MVGSTIPEGAGEALASIILVDANSIDEARWFRVSPEVMRLPASERTFLWVMVCRAGACLSFPAYESEAFPARAHTVSALGGILPPTATAIPRDCLQRWPARRPQLYRFGGKRAVQMPAFPGARAAASVPRGAGAHATTRGKSPVKAHAKTWTLLTMLVLGLWGSMIVLTGGGIKSHYQAGTKAQPGAPGVPAR